MMKNTLKTLFSYFFLGATLISTPLSGCTGLLLTAKDGKIIHGRTLEFGIFVDTSIALIPQGYSFHGTTPQGKGLAYTSKYAALGAITFNAPALMDGINEKGLAAGAFYFPGFASYSEITPENQAKAIAPTEFVNWLLTQFATIEEVKAALSSVVIAPTIAKEWGNQPPPFHYVVYDKSGKSLSIEPIGGKLVGLDNPLGVYTNSPTFDWHMQNLRNYINLSPNNKEPLQLGKLTLAPFGQGSGMVGLPGDYTPPSRFVRAAIFAQTALPSETADKAVGQAFHILNAFDIPLGVAREVVDGTIHSDYTLITCVRDPQALKFYFKTYDDQTVRFVDMTRLDLKGKGIIKAPTSGKPKVVDMTGELKS